MRGWGYNQEWGFNGADTVVAFCDTTTEITIRFLTHGQRTAEGHTDVEIEKLI